MKTDNNILVLDSVSAGYNGIPVIQNCFLQVRKSEVVVITGINGAGKSTLFKTVFGLIKCIKGNINFDGTGLNKFPTYKRVQLGISCLFQEKRIFDRLTVEENLLVAQSNLRNQQTQLLSQVYERYPLLYKKRKNYAGILSGGEQQLLCLCRIIIQRPKLILLDEPLSGLSPFYRTMIMDQIHSFAQEGITCLIIEHFLNEMSNILTSMYELKSGKLHLIK